MSKSNITLVVACKNACDEADLVIIELTATQEEVENNEHHKKAEETLFKNGYQTPFVYFDEFEQKNIHRIYEEIPK